MLKRDYIMTMVEQLAQFLARVLFLKETQRYDAALVEINDFTGKVFGAELDALRAMDADQLLALCVYEGEFTPDRAVALARLLKEVGDIDMRFPAGHAPCDMYGRALLLSLEAYGDGSRALPLDAVDTLNLLVERTLDCTLEADAARRLFRYLELRGYYADAENILYDLMDAGLADPLRDALPFYERLLARDDRDLEDGGLPRDEILEGLERLRDAGGEAYSGRDGASHDADARDADRSDAIR